MLVGANLGAPVVCRKQELTYRPCTWGSVVWAQAQAGYAPGYNYLPSIYI
jgi:hypothetical protein